MPLRPPLRPLSAALALAGVLLLAPGAGAQVSTPGGAGGSGLPGSARQGGGGAGEPTPTPTPTSGTGRESGKAEPEVPSDPAAPQPGGPAAPAAGSGAPSGPGSSTPIPLAGAFEATSWRVWWEHNKDPYLGLKRAVHRGHAVSGDDEFFLGAPGAQRDAAKSLAPTEALLEQRALPALLAALKGEPGNELRRELLLALARAGVDGRLTAAERLTDLAAEHLPHPDQRVSEAAVVALGLSADFRAVTLLHQLVAAGDEGRRAAGRAEVPRRVRALAAYAMGLASARSANVDVRRYVVRHLALILDAGAERELAAACVTALGLAPLPVGGMGYEEALDTREAGGATREGEVCYLVRLMRDEDADALVRAQAPTAMARLLAGLGPGWKDIYVDELRAGLLRGAMSPRELRQSCALALGAIGDADEDDADQRIRIALETALGDADLGTRFYALVSLAQAGGRPGSGAGEALAQTARVRRTLLDQLERGRSGARPWAGLALGVLGRTLLDSSRYPDAEVSAALLEALEEARSPEEVGAYALALGLRRDGQARLAIERKLNRLGADDALAGDLAVALGLLGAGAADEELRELARGSQHRPWVLLQASVGLALLGLKENATELASALEAADSLALQSALADVLGFVGDERAVETLVAQLGREDAPQFARAAFARALGRVADRDELPWATPLSSGLNYLAASELLSPVSGGSLVYWD